MGGLIGRSRDYGPSPIQNLRAEQFIASLVASNRRYAEREDVPILRHDGFYDHLRDLVAWHWLARATPSLGLWLGPLATTIFRFRGNLFGENRVKINIGQRDSEQVDTFHVK